MRLAGAPWERPEGLTVPAAFRKEKRAGRREYLRARLDGEGRAEVFASEGSGRISGLAWARGLVELEDGARTVAPGDPVRYLPFAAFGL
jgi:molybdopterin molybdotransferase